MNLVTIAWKSIRQRGLASALTALSVALGVMLMVTVLVIHGIVQDVFSQRSIGYDLIVGPKGSDLQLVLSTVFRVAPAIETLPYQYYLDLQKRPEVSVAIPFAFGDFTEQGGFPIVGTVDEFFVHEYAPQKSFRIRGRRLSRPFDAIIGSRVAIDNGWDIGSEFKLVHGGAESDHVHDEKFTVCAVLAPTGTANDRTVFIQLDGFYQIAGHEQDLVDSIRRQREFYGQSLDPSDIEKERAELTKKFHLDEPHDHGAHGAGDGHDHHHHDHGTPVVQKRVASILLQTKSTQTAILLSSELKRGLQAQAVNPIIPMARLMNTFVGNVRTVLMILTALIILVSGVGIFVSIYNSMSDRRKEIAIMRALGAGRTTVFSIILLESILLCVGGGLLGLLLGHGLVFVAAPVVQAKTDLLLSPWRFEPIELVLIPMLIALASLVGFVPGMTAYRTDVARALVE